MTGSVVDPDEHLAPDAVRNVLSGQAGGPSIQAGVIHGGVTLHLNRAADVGPPREWPGRSAVFVNQRTLLETMNGLWRSFPQDVPPVLALTGPGGVGKTTVATEWLHSTRSAFPDGELYADLGGPKLTATVRAEIALTRFLHQLGVDPKRIPLGANDLAAMFRSVVAGRRVAVLLDNPVTVAQVRLLLPHAAGSTVVITSRWNFPGLAGLVGARVVDVEPLDPPASVELLDRLVPDGRVRQDAAASRRLVGLCDGLPLALCIVGGSMASRRTRTVARAADRLTNRRTRLANFVAGGDVSVRAVFDDIYEELPPSVARMYRLLSVHPGPSFTVASAAAAVDVTEEEATEALDLLVEASLVKEVADERYGFQDLLRLHAAARAEQEERPEELAAALERLLRWYLRQTVRADLALMPGRWRLGADYAEFRALGDLPNTEIAWGWLETERPVLVACVIAAVESGLVDLASMLCEAMWSLFLLRGYRSDWVNTHERVVPVAGEAGDRRFEGRIRCQLGMAYQALERPDDAGEQFAAAYAADLAVDHRRGQATARELLGLLEHERERYDQAVESFSSALSLNDDPRAMGIVRRHLGAAHLGAGRIEVALAALDQAKASLAGLTPPDRYNEARVDMVRAQAYLAQGRPAEAHVILTVALAVMRAENARVQEAGVHALLAEVHQATGDRAEAQTAARRALALYEDVGDPPRPKIGSRLVEIADGSAQGSA
ncbi:NB-ARC domain-containing protein [Frankia sp. AiPs1]|uniref:tetratricopeptide repeat protein n=1 Tax=Frankia sp. AiPa1 TaxID=573492 RepID=UPI00202AD6A3|nr:tetratricopeptide repeat protein [Frankia sp. AiPa1]MCL9759112.1 tetratricopeptide repeat protein [Frankia sp. AiPa1]